MYVYKVSQARFLRVSKSLADCCGEIERSAEARSVAFFVSCVVCVLQSQYPCSVDLE